MKLNVQFKNEYTTAELLNYYELQKNKLLTSSKYIDRVVIDELFFLEKMITKYTQKYFNLFEIDVYSSITIANIICNKNNLEEYFYHVDYEKRFRNIIKYLVFRFNITSENNFYEIENIETSYFKIKDNDNNIFNVRRMFPSKKNVFNEEMIHFHKIAGISYTENDVDLLNKNIFRLSDYYYQYGSFLSFGDTCFYTSLDWYSKKMSEYNLNFSDDFQLKISRLPINFYDQDGINLLFKNVTEEIIIEDIHFYHKFVYKLYGQENKNGVYREVTENNYFSFSKFLLIANTKNGVAIYESSKGLQKYDGIVIDDESDIDLIHNTIYIKSKKDYLSINLKSTFHKNYYSKYITNSNINFIERLPLGIIKDKTDTDAFKYVKGKKYYIFYISKDKSQKGQVLEYVLNNLDIVEVEENLFEDDSSINYKIYVEENNIEILVLLDYLKKDLPAFKIYNISVKDLYHFMLKDDYFYENIVPHYKKSIEKHENKENNYYFKMQHVCNMIFEEIKRKYNLSFEEVMSLLNKKYLNKELLCEKLLNDFFIKLRNEKNEDYRQLRAREEYGEAPQYYKKYVLKLDDNTTRWKSEKLLYDIVSSMYPDAIYQYRNKWLVKQSLDIFIPSINTAIEYQGIQHYKQVNYFGDETDFSERKQNDEIKKELCENNNVMLIEWLYNDPISEILLKEKLGILKTDNIEETMVDELKKINDINTIKRTDEQCMIDEINDTISNIEIFVKSFENMREYNKKYMSNQTSLWSETVMNNLKYDLKNAKELQLTLQKNINLIPKYLELLNEKLTNVKNEIKYFKTLIINDKEIIRKQSSNINDLKPTTYTIDDSFIYEQIDERLANIDLTTLEKMKQASIDNEENTELIDKAIIERKKRDKILLEQKKREERENLKSSKMRKRSILFGILSGLFGSNSNKSKVNQPSFMPWEEKEIKKGNYEAYQFEEEELEDDDYYNEDID